AVHGGQEGRFYNGGVWIFGRGAADWNRSVRGEIGEGMVDLVLHVSFDELEDPEREQFRVQREVGARARMQHFNMNVVFAVACRANVEVDVDLGIGTVGFA